MLRTSFLLLAVFALLINATCTAPKVAFTYTRSYKNWANEELTFVYEGTSTSGDYIIFQEPEQADSNNVRTYEFCLEFDKTYSFVLMDSYSDGWTPGSSASLAFGSIVFFNTMGPGYGEMKTLQVSLVLAISDSTLIKYSSVAQSGNDWTTAAYNDGSWTTYASGSFPSVSTITRYYRYSLTGVSSTKYGLVLNIMTTSGFVAYINGQEVLRVGLPTASTSNTFSTTSETSTTTKEVAIPLSVYNPTGGAITLAIEIHRSESQADTADPLVIRAYMLEGEDYSSIGGYNGVSTCSRPGSSELNKVCANVFDGDLSTSYMVTSTIPAGDVTITYAFPNGAGTWFNGYQIISGNTWGERDPRSWKFYASVDGTTWVLLDVRTNQGPFESRSTPYTYPVRSNNQIYKHIKLEVTSDNGYNQVEIGELRVVANNAAILADAVLYEPASHTIELFTTVDISPATSGISQYTISPALPLGLSFDAESGRIYGVAEVGTTVTDYTITGISNVSTSLSSFTLHLIIASCDQPQKVSLRITKKNGNKSIEESWTIKDSAGTVLNQGTGSNYGADVITNDCFVADRYTITMEDSGGNGWASSSLLIIEMRLSSTQSVKLANYNMVSGSSVTYHLNTKLAANNHDSWKYMQGTSVPAGWYGASFSDASWQSVVDLNPPQVISNIILLRKTFTVTKANSHGWTLNFKASAGAVVYVNGVEVYRYYLPAGDVTPATTATGGDSTFVYRTISGPMTHITGSTLTFAIALVNLGSGFYSLDFGGYLMTNGDAESPLMLEGSYSASSGSSMAYALFDGRMDSRWQSDEHDSVTPHWFEIAFAHQSFIYANKYCLVSGSDRPQSDIIDWSIQGMLADNTYVNITTETNVSWEDRLQRQCFYMPNNNVAYKGYRFNALKAAIIQSGNQYILTEFELYQEDLDAINIPPLSFTNAEYETYRGIAASPLLVSSIYYRNFVISPALPAGLTLDSSNGYINGVPTATLPRTAYTITATSIKGVTATTTVYITIKACTSPKNLFTLRFTFTIYGNEAGWTFKNSNQQVLASRTAAISHATQNFGFCDVTDVYTLILTDTYNDGWDDGYLVIVLEDGTQVLRATVGRGESPKTIQVNIGRIIGVGGKTWKYTLASPGSEWTSYNYNDNSWNSADSESLPVVTSTTQYYRYKFAVATLPSIIAAIDVSASTYAGMIVYLNGKEVRRYNMPYGVITDSTLATTEYADYVLVSTVVPVYQNYLFAGDNIIAIEVHKYTNIPAKNTFDAVIGFISDGEYRVTQGTYWSDIMATGNEGIDKLFDGSITTKMLTGPRCVGAAFQWNYNNGRREFINHYKITNANDCQHRHPTGWKLSGYNEDNESWDILHLADKITWTGYRQTKAYDFFSSRGYNQYRLDITACDMPYVDTYCNSGSIQLAELGFYVTSKEISCQATKDYPPALDGSYAYRNCDAGYKGYRRVLCTSGTFGAESQFCELTAPSMIRYPVKSLRFITKKYNQSPAPRIIGANYTIIIAPKLPEGLQLNPTTGIISGTPVVDIPDTTFNVTCYNPVGRTYGDITISSTAEPGLGAGLIAVIVVAAVIIVIFVGVIIFCIVNRTKRSSKGHKQLSTKKSTAKSEKSLAKNSSAKAVKV